MAELVTVRIPNLVAKTTDLKAEDRLPIWDSDIDKTRRIDLATLRSYILSNGGSTIIPTQSGASLIYIVGDADAGGNTASIPSIAGDTFSLSRDGLPLIPETNPADPDNGEFGILSAGGFKLKGDGELIKGQRYELKFAAVTGGSGGGTGTSTGSLIKGVKIITTNFTLTADHLNLLIQIRLGATAASLTLPDLADVPENTIIPVEAMINNSTMCKFQTQGGQYIYFANTSINNASAMGLYIGPGEQIWFMAGSDGWYALNPFGNFNEVGLPVPRFKPALNEIWATGQLIARTGLYARLYEFAESLPFSMVDESVWQTPSIVLGGRTILNPYKGCFSRGTTSSNFRLPDLTNMVIKGLANGADALRAFNHAGGLQQEMGIAHSHKQHGQTAVSVGGTIPALFQNVTGGDQETGTSTSNNTGDYAGPKNLVDNIGMFYCLKY